MTDAGMKMNNLVHWLQRGRLTLQEFGPSMAMLTLPGGSFVALTGWIYRHWRPTAARR